MSRLRASRRLFWYRGYRDLHGELSPIERMELDEEELREFGLNAEAESEE
jgi:hypothetical protein